MKRTGKSQRFILARNETMLLYSQDHVKQAWAEKCANSESRLDLVGPSFRI